MDANGIVNTAILVFILGCTIKHERQLARIEQRLKDLVGGES